MIKNREWAGDASKGIIVDFTIIIVCTVEVWRKVSVSEMEIGSVDILLQVENNNILR